eukprot:7138310-Prymnesium_polylepis.1
MLAAGGGHSSSSRSWTPPPRTSRSGRPTSTVRLTSRSRGASCASRGSPFWVSGREACAERVSRTGHMPDGRAKPRADVAVQESRASPRCFVNNHSNTGMYLLQRSAPLWSHSRLYAAHSVSLSNVCRMQRQHPVGVSGQIKRRPRYEYGMSAEACECRARYQVGGADAQTNVQRRLGRWLAAMLRLTRVDCCRHQCRNLVYTSGLWQNE